MPSFTLPDHVDIATDTFHAIAVRHGLTASTIERLPDTGIINAAYRIGKNAVLRVPRNHPNFIADGYREAVAVPGLAAAGVRTPNLIAFDDSLELLPVPYTVYEWVPGVSLESLELDPDEAAEAWREHGRTLARAHVGVPIDGSVARLEQRHNLADLPAALAKRVQEGWLSPLDARWLGRWLERLAPAALAPMPSRFIHGDTQATNIMVSTDPLRYEAIIDWGAAALDDAALDFAGVPLRAVPYMLAGHREVAPLDGDDTAEHRIVWRHLDLVLGFLPRGAVPGRSWGERPLPMLLEVLRFFLDPPDDRWRALGPVEPTAYRWRGDSGLSIGGPFCRMLCRYGREVPTMSETTSGLRGARARAERRRAEKAQQRRIEIEAAGFETIDTDTPTPTQPSNRECDAVRDGSQRAERIGLVAGVQRGGALSVLAGSDLYSATMAKGLNCHGYVLTVGDQVRVLAAGIEHLARATIVGVEPRRTRLARIREDRTRRSAFSREEAVLAANVDIAVIVAAVADPPFHPKLVDRFLVICQYGGIRPILCLNKCDLVATPPDLTIYEQIGLPIVYASAATGAGLDDLRRALAGSVAVFTGHSGVGKSSLVNALLGEDRQIVGAVRSADGRGRHTTTASSLLRLDDDSYLVDTPGVRSLGIWKLDPLTLASYFPDFDPFSAGCRFSTCTHTHEPACGVKEAVETGEIVRQRYESYVRLMEG